MGKGSTPRPFSIAQDEYANRWDAIFGRDKITAGRDKAKKQEEPVEFEAGVEDEDEDDTCSSCGGPMYTQPHWAYSKCDDCGRTVRKEYDV